MFWVKLSLLVIFYLIILKSTNANEEVTVCGAKCATKCTMSTSHSYMWCGVWSITRNSKWDYCSLPGQTTSGEPCVSSCQKKGRSLYYWCETKDSWDYCSPPKASGHGINCTGTSGWTIFGFLCGIVGAVLCCLVCFFVLRSCVKSGF